MSFPRKLPSQALAEAKVLNLVIPNGVTSIGQEYWGQGLTSVSIPDSVVLFDIPFLLYSIFYIVFGIFPEKKEIQKEEKTV